MPLALALGLVLLAWSPAAPARGSDLRAEVLAQQDQPQASPPQTDTPQVQPEVKPEERKPVPYSAPVPINPQLEAKPDQAAPPAVVPDSPSVQKQTTPKPAGQASKTAPAKKRTSTARKTTVKKTTPRKTVVRRHRRKKRTSPTSAQKQSSDPPAKVVVPHGSTPDRTIQLTPTVSQQQASTQLQNTNQLLGTTDANLKKISNRQLNATQQETVSQIRTFMEQAKVAVSAGDVQRANNLAVKAQLLSEELVKQQ